MSGRVGRRTLAVIPRGRDHDDVLRPGVINGVLQILTEAGVAEPHEDNVGAMVRRPDDTADDVSVLAGPVGTEHGNGHDADAGVADACDPGVVIGVGRNNPRQRGAVAVRIGAPISGAVKDGNSGHDLAGQVGVRGVDAGVKHRHNSGPLGRGVKDLAPADLGQGPLGAEIRVEGDHRLDLPLLVLLYP